MAVFLLLAVTQPEAVSEGKIRHGLAWTESPEDAQRVASEQVRGRLRDAISARLEGAPVEDGHHHPVQELLEQHLNERGWFAALDVADVFGRLDVHEQTELMRCLGRLTDRQLVRQAILDVARRCLASESLSMRDATICTLEQWGTPESVALLEAHREPIPWLRAYCEQVVREARASRASLS